MALTPVQRNLLIGSAALGVLLYAGTASAAPRRGGGNGNGNGKGGGGTRPNVYPNPPAGSGRGTVAPYCAGAAANDPGCVNGIVLHRDPSIASPQGYWDVNKNRFTLAGDDPSPTSVHLVSGRAFGGSADTAVILQADVADTSGRPGQAGRLWTEVITPLGTRGWASQRGPNEPSVSNNASNFTNFTKPTTQPALIGQTPGLRRVRRTSTQLLEAVRTAIRERQPRQLIESLHAEYIRQALAENVFGVLPLETIVAQMTMVAPVPAPTPPPGTQAYRYTVAVDDLNVRAVYTRISPVVTTLNRGETVVAPNQNDARQDPSNPNLYYILVERPDGTPLGWVAPVDQDGRALLINGQPTARGASGQARVQGIPQDLGWAPWGGSAIGQETSPATFVNPAEQAAWRAYEQARAVGQPGKVQRGLYNQAVALRQGVPGLAGPPGFSPGMPRVRSPGVRRVGGW